MTKKPRWWRCIANVHVRDEHGENDRVLPIVLHTDEKCLLSSAIDDINTKLRSTLLAQGAVYFVEAECRCIILDKDPKATH